MSPHLELLGAFRDEHRLARDTATRDGRVHRTAGGTGAQYRDQPRPQHRRAAGARRCDVPPVRRARAHVQVFVLHAAFGYPLRESPRRST